MHSFGSGLCRTLLVAFGLVAAATLPARANPYVMAPGDTVELSVVGAPELHTKAMIDVDGRIHFPLVTPLQAAGQTVDDLQAEVSRQLSQQSYRQRTQDGRTAIAVIEPGEVSVNVAEYRPVYVRGDVAKPGEQPFRPGITVRQVIALAGGYDVMRFHMENPIMQSSDLRAQYEQLWTGLARQEAHAALIKAEIAGQPAPNVLGMIKAPIPAATLADIVRTETEQVATEAADHQRQLAFLKTASDNAAEDLKSYTKPKSDAQQSEADENAYMQRLGQLAAKGVVARPQVIDQQRSMLQSSERFLNYTARIAELEKNRADSDRKAEHLVDDRRALLLKDLQDCTVQIATLRSNLQAVSEKLLYTGVIKSQLVRGTGSRPEIRIVHAGQGGAEDAAASEDTALSAGDTVDVSLRAEMMPEAATR